MAVTADDLLELARASSDADRALAERCVTLASSYVAKYRQDQDPDGTVAVPPPVVDNAQLSCAEDIFTRSKSQNGVILENYQPGDDGAGVVVRIGRDPLASVRPLLAPWYAPLGFA